MVQFTRFYKLLYIFAIFFKICMRSLYASAMLFSYFKFMLRHLCCMDLLFLFLFYLTLLNFVTILNI